MLIFTLSGCSKHEISDITPKTYGFKCDFTVCESELGGTVTVDENRDLTVVFSTPEKIAGFGMTVQTDGVIIELQGITEKYSMQEIPGDSPAVKLYNALITAEGLTPSGNDGEITVEHEDFSALLNGTGFITQISFKDTRLSMLFSNFTEIK